MIPYNNYVLGIFIKNIKVFSDDIFKMASTIASA